LRFYTFPQWSVIALALFLLLNPVGRRSAWAAAASPQPPQAPSSIKIGVVDLQKVLVTSSSGQEALKNLRGEIEKKQDALREKMNSLEKLRAELSRQELVLSAATKKEKEDSLRQQMKELQRFQDDTKQEFARKESEMTQKILAEILEIVKKIAKDEGYTLIIEQREGLLYTADTINITEKVLKAYNAQPKR